MGFIGPLCISLIILTSIGCRRPQKNTNQSAFLPGQEISFQLVMKPVHVQYFGENGMEWELTAPEARGYSKASVLGATNLTITLYKGGQKSTTITSDEGLINSGDEPWAHPNVVVLYPGDMYLNGHVVVVSTDSSRLQTDWVNFKKADKIIVSTAPVELIRENTVTKGRGLEATPDLQSVKIFDETLVIQSEDE